MITAPPTKFRRLSRKKQDELIEKYLPLAKQIARSAFHRLPNHRYEDILGAAHLGLVDAARRFLPGKKVPFECYARTRITGSIIDSHRALHKTQYVNEFPPDPVDDGGWFTKPVADDMLRKAMATVLTTLDPFERSLIELRYWEDLTLREIAARLDVSECHVSHTHRRLLSSLSIRVAQSGLSVQ